MHDSALTRGGVLNIAQPQARLFWFISLWILLSGVLVYLFSPWVFTYIFYFLLLSGPFTTLVAVGMLMLGSWLARQRRPLKNDVPAYRGIGVAFSVDIGCLYLLFWVLLVSGWPWDGPSAAQTSGESIRSGINFVLMILVLGFSSYRLARQLYCSRHLMVWLSSAFLLAFTVSFLVVFLLILWGYSALLIGLG